MTNDLDTGTKRGIHYWESWLHCPRRAQLDCDARAKGEVTSTDSDATELGSTVHQYLRAYYDPGSTEPIEVTDAAILTDHDKLVKKAEHIFRQYRARHPANDLGKVVATEWRFPQTPKHLDILEEHFPVMFTGAIDMVVRLSMRQAERLMSETAQIVEPGYYLVDHKTMGFIYPQARPLFRGSMQMRGYCHAWKLLHPRRRLNGYIINGITTSAKSTTCRIVCPPPTEEQVQALMRHLGICLRIREGGDMPFAHNCFFPQPCIYMNTDKCWR